MAATELWQCYSFLSKNLWNHQSMLLPGRKFLLLCKSLEAPQLLRFIAPELLSIRQLDISRRRLWWLPSSLRSCERWKPQPLFHRHECSAKFSSTSDSRAEVKSFAARIWDKEVSSLLLKEVQDLLAIENLRRNFKEEFFKNSTLI